MIKKSHFSFARIVLISAIVFSFNEISAQSSSTISKDLKWSERMALSVIKRAPKAWQVDNNEKPKWDYKLGLLMTSFEKLHQKTNNPVYGDYIKAYGETVVNPSGEIMNYKLEDYNIDYVNP
ncbi:MAG: glycoside hydrolase family 88 protein, partial [Flavobacterium sp.]